MNEAPIQDSQEPLPYPGPDLQRPPKRHSWMGIVSTMIAIVVGIVQVGIEYHIDVMEARYPGGDNSADFILGFFGYLICGLALLIGFGLGIVGVNRSKRRMLFPILGTFLNTIVALGMLAVIILTGLRIK